MTPAGWPTGKFGAILADPPWGFNLWWGGRSNKTPVGVPSRATTPHYDVMKEEELNALPVSGLAADDCVLFLWTCWPVMPWALRAMEAWGFRYLAPVHWIKPSGVGNWFVHRTQTMLMGYKTRCRFERARYRPNIVMTGDPKRHSEKPEEFRAIIDTLYPNGKRIELFSRSQHEGWESWGNEAAA